MENAFDFLPNYLFYDKDVKCCKSEVGEVAFLSTKRWDRRNRAGLKSRPNRVRDPLS